MLRKTTVHLLVCALLWLIAGRPSVSAGAKEEKATAFAAKVKSEIARLGTGPEAQIEIRLRDRKKLKGYVSKIGEGSFAIMDPKTGIETDVPYPAVTQAKGKNLSTGAIVAISILAGIGIVFIVLWIIYAANA